MSVVGILVLVHAHGLEVNGAGGLIDGQHVFHVEGTVGNRVLQRAVCAIEIQLGPAVALAPPDDFLAAIDETGRAGFYISVEGLVDDGTGRVCLHVDADQVGALEVAAAADHIEAVVVTHPDALAPVVITVDILAGAAQDIGVLVLVGGDVDLAAALVRHVEEEEMVHGAGLTGHLILVGLQGRTRLGHGVDDPEILHLGHVVFRDGEVLRVGRPHHVVGRAPGRILDLCAAIVAAAPVEILGAVAGQAVVHHGGVLLVLHQLLHVVDVHPVKVIALGIDGFLPVGGDAGPHRIILLLLILGHIHELARGEDILETVHLLFFLRLALGLGLRGIGVVLLLFLLLHHLGALDLESELVVVLQLKFAERQVLGIERVLDDGGNLHGEALHIEGLDLGLGHGIDDVEFRAFGRLPLVPELVGVLEPVGTDRGAEDHVVHLLGGKLVGQFIIRLLRQCRTAQEQRGKAEEDESFHIFGDFIRNNVVKLRK